MSYKGISLLVRGPERGVLAPEPLLAADDGSGGRKAPAADVGGATENLGIPGMLDAGGPDGTEGRGGGAKRPGD